MKPALAALAGILYLSVSPSAAPHPQVPAAAPVSPNPLTYEAALQLATTRNLGLAAAMRQRAIREADVRIAGQLLNPDFSLEVTRDVPHEAVSIGFPIEIGGKRARRIELAREQLALADLDVRSAERTLRRNLRQAFFGLVAADERVRNAEAVLEIVRRVRDISNARYQEGAVARLEVMQAELGVGRSEADLELARSTRAVVQADLNAVLNQPPGQTVSVVGNLAAPPGLVAFDEAMKLATESNVDLARVNREIAIERRRTTLLRAERIPTPTLSIGGMFDAPGEFNAGLNGALSLTIPLFSRNQGEIAQSTATVAQLQAEREAVVRTMESSVYGAWARLDAQRRNVEVYREKLLPTATTLESLAEESYRAGRTPVLAVLEAQRALRDVRRDYLQALTDFQTAIADLEEVLGVPIQ